MFTNSKPTASLSSGLLARKGQARPAMRPQGFVGMTPTTLEDLGWNDMGDAAVAPLTPDAVVSPPADVPPVLRQREKLVEEIAAPEAIAPEPEPDVAPVRQPVPVAKAARIARESSAKGPKAAFTLRLDTDRHLRLRLASAVCNRSAQALVTQALDAFLETVPEVEDLASQLPAGTNR